MIWLRTTNTDWAIGSTVNTLTAPICFDSDFWYEDCLLHSSCCQQPGDLNYMSRQRSRKTIGFGSSCYSHMALVCTWLKNQCLEGLLFSISKSCRGTKQAFFMLCKPWVSCSCYSYVCIVVSSKYGRVGLVSSHPSFAPSRDECRPGLDCALLSRRSPLPKYRRGSVRTTSDGGFCRPLPAAERTAVSLFRQCAVGLLPPPYFD